MAIYDDISFSHGDLLTADNLQKVYENSINTTDDIHPQYGEQFNYDERGMYRLLENDVLNAQIEKKYNYFDDSLLASAAKDPLVYAGFYATRKKIGSGITISFDFKVDTSTLSAWIDINGTTTALLTNDNHTIWTSFSDTIAVSTLEDYLFFHFKYSNNWDTSNPGYVWIRNIKITQG